MNGHKVCIVTPEFPPFQWGGLARTAERVAKHARDAGMIVHVAHFQVDAHSFVLLDENRETEIAEGLTVHHIRLGKEGSFNTCRDLWDCPHTLTLQMMYQSLQMLQNEFSYNLFHSFFLYPVGYVVGLIAKYYSVPTIATIVGNDIKKYLFSPEKTAVCKSGLENADLVVGLSSDLVGMANSLVPIFGKSRVIFNSVELPEFEKYPSRRSCEEFKIGCAGIFKYAKGLPYLFKAIAAAKHKSKIRLELCGDLRSSEEEIFDYMLNTSGIRGQLTWLGPLQHEKIYDWLKSLDVFVLPSLTEGCPNILMEALACGTPCIATKTGAIPDLIENSLSGLLVPWGDSKSLADALDYMLDNPDRAVTMGTNGRHRMERFSPQREFQAWKNIYSELMNC